MIKVKEPSLKKKLASRDTFKQFPSIIASDIPSTSEGDLKIRLPQDPDKAKDPAKISSGIALKLDEAPTSRRQSSFLSAKLMPHSLQMGHQQ